MGRRKNTEKKLLDSPLATADERGLRVKRIRNMANLTRQELCENSGININSLKGWEIGRYGGLTWQGAEKIISYAAKEGVTCTVDWLMYGIGAGPSVQTGFTETKIPQASPLVHKSRLDQDQDEDEKIANELTLFKKQYANAIDFIVNDEGMTPFYQYGEYVAGIALKEEKIDQAIGQNCIVQLENKNILLRQLRKGSSPSVYTLICLNTNMILEPVLYNVKLISAAPVIFHRIRNIFN